MRKRFLSAAIVAASILVCAPPASADEYILDPSKAITLPTCAAGGGASVAVPAGLYLLIGAGEEGRICFAGTCATGGMIVHVGTRDLVYMRRDGLASCRSTNAIAVHQLVPAEKR